MEASETGCWTDGQCNVHPLGLFVYVLRVCIVGSYEEEHHFAQTLLPHAILGPQVPPTLGVMGFSKAASYELISAVCSESHSGTLVPWSLTADTASVWEAFEMPWTTAAAIGVISRWCQPKSCRAVQVPHHAGMLSRAQSHVTSELRRSPGCPCQELLTSSRAP